MSTEFKTVQSSRISISELMLPSRSNFNGKIHGGYILSLLDQIAFACASKFSGFYCVTASVDTVDFLNPIEIGELVTMKASINYVGKSSMIVGIRVEAENIQTGAIKHCNSSHFTMVAKKDNGENAIVPGLILSNKNDLRRFFNATKQIMQRKERNLAEQNHEYTLEKAMSLLENYNVKLETNLL